MRKEIRMIILYGLLLFVASIVVWGSESKAKSISITKKNFPDKCIRKELKLFDKNKNGRLEEKEQKKIDYIEVSVSYKNINLKGLSKLKNIEEIHLSTYKKVKNINEITKLKKLKVLDIEGSADKISIKNKPYIKKLDIKCCKTKEVEVANNAKLKKLYIKNNTILQRVKVSDCPKLNELHIRENQSLEEIVVENHPRLKTANLNKNTALKKLQITKTPKLQLLYAVSEGNFLQQIELDTMEKLHKFYLGGAVSTNLKLENMPNLQQLAIKKCKTLTYDILKVPQLRVLTVEGEEKEELDVTMLKNLEVLNWKNGTLKTLKANREKLQRLDLAGNKLSGEWDLNQYPNVSYFDCSDNQLEKITLNNHPNIIYLACRKNNLKEVYACGVPYLYHFAGEKNSGMKLFLSKENKNFTFDATATVHYQTNELL